MITVSGLSITAVKGTRVRAFDAIELGERGARGDRAFYLIDARGQMVNGKRWGELQAIVADFDPDGRTLALALPDGTTASGAIAHAGPVQTTFFSRPREAQELRGPWSEALSAFFGEPLRLVEVPSAVDRGRKAAVSLISRASLRRLAQSATCDTVDDRRFRMTIEVEGVDAHAEDSWIGERVRIGAALVRFRGNIGRCMVTTRNPDTGAVDLQTLHALADYRRHVDSSEPLPFGIYGEVLAGGTVRVGDPVEPIF
jgi:uncharacterized protein YcbX